MSQKQPKIEINENSVNPELEKRRELNDLEFLAEMLVQIENRKTQILAQMKGARDMLKILQIDYERTKSLYRKEQIRMRTKGKKQ